MFEWLERIRRWPGLAAARLVASSERSRSPYRDEWERNAVRIAFAAYGARSDTSRGRMREGTTACNRGVGLGVGRALLRSNPAPTHGPRQESRPSAEVGVAAVLKSANRCSGIGPNAKNLRGRSRDTRDRMSDTGQPPPVGAPLRTQRNAAIQATGHIDDGPSIILIRPPSIIVTTLSRFLPTFFDGEADIDRRSVFTYQSIACGINLGPFVRGRRSVVT